MFFPIILATCAHQIQAFKRSNCALTNDPILLSNENKSHTNYSAQQIRCIRIVITSGGHNINDCPTFTVETGISLNSKGICLRWDVSGKKFKKESTSTQLIPLVEGDVIECHCGKNDNCDRNFTSIISDIVQNSDKLIGANDRNCLSSEVASQILFKRQQKQSLREDPGWKRAREGKITSNPSLEINFSIIKYDDDVMVPDQSKISNELNKTGNDSFTNEPTERVVTGDLRITEKDLRRKVSLHLLMISLVMWTLMACQLLILRNIKAKYQEMITLQTRTPPPTHTSSMSPESWPSPLPATNRSPFPPAKQTKDKEETIVDYFK